ncbi:hypothetical protein CDAR_32351 [Caerostris darwini]|uniref:Uncharacterized protein n=1 Tax=Caerostris darwini TaxID=1538125 RepID=A0AAV4WNS2_9ARAC|nr:hypothetical protein CDAR_32351 [Caerostris darwini]
MLFKIYSPRFVPSVLSRLDLSLCSVYWMQSGVYSYIFSGFTNGGVLPGKETDPLLYYPELLSGTFCLPEVRLFVLDPQRHGRRFWIAFNAIIRYSVIVIMMMLVLSRRHTRR